MSIHPGTMIAESSNAIQRLRQPIINAITSDGDPPGVSDWSHMSQIIGGTDTRIIAEWLGGGAFYLEVVEKPAGSQVWKITSTAYDLNTPSGWSGGPYTSYSFDTSPDCSIILSGHPFTRYELPTPTPDVDGVGLVKLRYGANWGTIVWIYPDIALRTTNRYFGLEVAMSDDAGYVFITSRNTDSTQDLYIYTGSTGTGVWTLQQTITGVATSTFINEMPKSNLHCTTTGDYVVLGGLVYRRGGGGTYSLTTTLAGTNRSGRFSGADSLFTIDATNNIKRFTRSGSNWNLIDTITSATYGAETASISKVDCSTDGTTLVMNFYTFTGYVSNPITPHEKHTFKRLTLSGGVWSLSEAFTINGDLTGYGNNIATPNYDGCRWKVICSPTAQWWGGPGFISYTQDFVS